MGAERSLQIVHTVFTRWREARGPPASPASPPLSPAAHLVKGKWQRPSCWPSAGVTDVIVEFAGADTTVGPLAAPQVFTPPASAAQVARTAVFPQQSSLSLGGAFYTKLPVTPQSKTIMVASPLSTPLRA